MSVVTSVTACRARRGGRAELRSPASPSSERLRDAGGSEPEISLAVKWRTRFCVVYPLVGYFDWWGIVIGDSFGACVYVLMRLSELTLVSFSNDIICSGAEW